MSNLELKKAMLTIDYLRGELSRVTSEAKAREDKAFNDGVEALMQAINNAPDGLTAESILKEFIRVIRPTKPTEAKDENK